VADALTMPSWEHFEHDADIGIRGMAASLEQAFEQAALAMTAVITDLGRVSPAIGVRIVCEATDDELLFLSWINELVYQMAVQRMLFSRFQLTISKGYLAAMAFGEVVDQVKHQPAVEIKGATFTELKVRQLEAGWLVQCVVDV